MAAAGLAYFLAGVLGDNLHPVLPGAVYRSAQPGASELARWAPQLGLASVLVARPARPHKRWYTEERRAAQEWGLELHHVDLDPDRMPSRAQLAALVAALDSAPRPLLLHCRAGVERSGLASAVALLLEGQSLEAARDQFSIRFGFHPWLARSRLPEVLDRYAAWLRARDLAHTPDAFRRFARQGYVAGFYAADLELLDFPDPPASRSPLEFGLRVTNRSPEPIRFRADRDRGVHVGTTVVSAGDDGFRSEGRAGRRDLTLAPGASERFAVSLGRLPGTGRYRLRVDLVDESVVWFAEMGSRPLVVEFAVGGGESLAATTSP